MPSKPVKVTGPTPTEVFIQRVKEVRERRRWTQRDMCARLAAVGKTTDPATLARVEVGKRGVSLDDAIAYSAVLGPGLVNMVVPLDDMATVALAPDVVVSAPDARWWLRGVSPVRPVGYPNHVGPLPDDDDFRTVGDEQPSSEKGSVGQLMSAVEMLTRALREGTPEHVSLLLDSVEHALALVANEQGVR